MIYTELSLLLDMLIDQPRMLMMFIETLLALNSVLAHLLLCLLELCVPLLQPLQHLVNVIGIDIPPKR